MADQIKVTTPDGVEHFFPPEATPDQITQALKGYSQQQGCGVGAFVDNVGRQLANGMSFGFADEIAAGGNATLGKIGDQFRAGPSRSWGQMYDENLAAERAHDRQFEAAHPYVATGAQIAGNVAGAIAGTRLLPMAAPATVPAMIGRGVTAGAVGGAISGFGSGEGGFKNRAIGAAGGAALGATFGGAATVAAPILARSWALARNALGLQDAERMAADKLAQAFERDGITLEEAQRRIAQWQQQGAKPEMLADVGGENVRSLAQAAAGTPGPGKQRAVRMLEQRRAGQGERIAADMDATMSDLPYHATQDELLATRQAAAGPLYEQAYQATPISLSQVQPGGQLAALMSRPSMRAAAQRALRIAAEEGRDPSSLGIDFNAAGDPVFARVPSWQTLDYVKRGLDDVLEAMRDPTSGRLVLDESGRAIQATRVRFRQLLRDENPAFGQALDAYSGPSDSLDALAYGRNILSSTKVDSQAIVRRVQDMTPGERAFYRAGVRQAIVDRVLNTPDGADAVRRFFNTPGMRAKLMTAFENPQDWQRFYNQMTREATMARVENQVSPRVGSMTDLRAAARQDLGRDSVVNSVAESVVSGDSPRRAVLRTLLDRSRGINGPTANSLTTMLFNTNPQQQLGTLDRLIWLQNLQRQQRLGRQNLARGLLMSGGAAAGQGFNEVARK